MQETKIRTSGDDDPPTERPQWVRLVAIALAIALVAGLLIAAIQGVTSSGADPDPNPGGAAGTNPEPDFSLTDEEAVETFERLSTTLREAVAQRDLSLLVLVTTSGGNTNTRTHQEIQRLKADGVVDQTEVETTQLDVLKADADQIEVREVVHLFPCFETEAGKDITRADAVVEQTGIWTLRLQNGRWLIDDTQLESDRVVDDRRARCNA
ncbi:MAG: hypothetical protein ACR2H7_05005 [Actinomycetota bacterium]